MHITVIQLINDPKETNAIAGFDGQVEKLFEANGLLSQAIEGFRPRPFAGFRLQTDFSIFDIVFPH